ncbi:MAG: hypothetical protein QOE70_2797 [Chthoniobacter sp.]|nr:hypothetical protein [Chthoniobacter sp.]
MLALAGFAAAGAAAWFFLENEHPLPPPLRVPELAVDQTEPVAPAEPAPADPVAKAEPPEAPPPTDAPADLPPSVAELEQQFRAAGSVEDRIELARQIADGNNTGAVRALGRLLQLERQPAVKLALLARLNDIDPEVAPEARLDALAFALIGQPRNVRIAVLESLAQIDDPRVGPLLQKAMTTDPGREVRNTAAALYRARFESAAR